MNYLTKTGLLVIVLASFMALAACSGTGKTMGENVDDTVVHSKVKTELIGEGLGNINIEVHQGLVQLAGFVETTYEREKAASSIKDIRGVRGVSNQLVVKEAGRTAGRTLDDGVIAGKVKARLADDPRTSSLRINVEVRSGVVLLSGFVVDKDEKANAVKVAARTEGVVDVIDGMDVI